MVDIFSGIAAFLAGLIKTTFGVGAGVFLTPILSIPMAPKIAVALMAPMMLASDISTLGLHWKQWDLGHFKLLIPGGILGVIVGANYLAWASQDIAQISIGLIAMAFSGFQIIRLQKSEYFQKINLKPVHGVIISFFAGISSAIAHSGGIVLSLYLITLNLEKRIFVTTLIIFLFVNDIVKTLLFYRLEILTVPVLWKGIVLSPLLLLGSFLGSKLIKKLSQQQFIYIVNILIFLSGLILIVK